MSPRYPVCNSREVQRVLRQAGFALVAAKGSHEKWRHPDGRQVIVPNHGAKPIPIGTLKNIIEGSHLPLELFRES